jgi:hypothetical protein
MNRLVLVFALWFGLILLGVLARVELHTTPAPVTTVRTLPQNYIVRTGDVMIPGVTGRYLKEEVKEGGTLTAEQLMPLPMIAPRILSLSVPTQKKWVDDESINAGKDVKLCRNKEPAYPDPIRTLAVQCGLESIGKLCVVIAQMPAVAADAVAKITAPDVEARPATADCK